MFSFAEAEQKANIINNSIVPFGMKLEKAMSQTSSQFHLSFPKLTMTQKYEYISLYLSILYPIRKWSYYTNSELSHSLDSDNTSVLAKICGYYMRNWRISNAAWERQPPSPAPSRTASHFIDR